MKKILAFFGIGIVILFLDLVFNYDEDELNIFISDQEIESLIYAWELQVGRSPTRTDIKNIIDDVIKEEILYREALRLNLDLEDRIIKRRLAQKISFLREETSIAPPKSDELQKFFDKNLDSYIFPERFTFTHLYFSSERNGKQRSEEALKNIQEQFTVLREGKARLEATIEGIDQRKMDLIYPQLLIIGLKLIPCHIEMLLNYMLREVVKKRY